jgi:para-aminobenzoate synthetase component I
MLDKKQAIARMNKMGQNNIPFFFAINFNQSQTILQKLDSRSEKDILFNFNGTKNYPVQKSIPNNFTFCKHPVNFDYYLKSFNYVQTNILLGNSYLVNLTQPTEIETSLSLDELFHLSHAKYKLLVKNKWVCFSPESFVKIDNGNISAYPMKGTIDAKIENANQQIIENKKETAEHATIVDLIRNDISISATGVEVEKYRYIDEIQTNEGSILQVSSKIIGKLPINYPSQIGSIIFGMLPAGSISGAPKCKTLEIIRHAEHYERGFYTGVAGIFDGQNLDSCVLIRFIEKEGNKLIFKSGGGITSQSNPQEEYKELISKVYVPISRIGQD